ncbi:MAG: phage/plasmid primase, P4 family [Xanthobacteraceae bacterium]
MTSTSKVAAIVQNAAPPSNDPPPQYSQDDLAAKFVARYSRELRFIADKNKWVMWDGTCWREDAKKSFFNKARLIAREAANEILLTSNKKPAQVEAKALASSKTRAAIIALASDDPKMATATKQWDIDDFALNTPGGIVNLKTGEMRPHSHNEFVTKITAVAPDAGVKIERWLKFLDEVTAGDRELRDYLQRVCGYCLTGDTSEQALFFAHGFGGNGKGVFFRTVTEIMGDYHRTAGIETFTASSFDRHTTELAALHAARLVTSSETEEGRKWAEARIKQLTGADPIEARFMRQDSFTFVPKFKLLISGNHKPGVRAVDAAIRRRMNLIPFTVTIEKVNKHLHDELREEWPGILAWMVEGCRSWSEKGLNPPDAVKIATDEYLDDEDAVAGWINDRCEQKPNAYAPVSLLYDSFCKWAAKANEYAGTRKKFSQWLEGKGFKRKRGDARGFIGLELRKDGDGEDEAM